LRTSLVYFNTTALANMQARLLNYHKQAVPDCTATLWAVQSLNDQATTILLDSRVTGTFTGAEVYRNIVAEGESTTYGSGAAFGLDWPTQVYDLGFDGLVFNQANASQTVADLVLNYTTQVFPLRPLGSVTECYLFVMIGIKDAGLDRAAATIMSDINVYLTTANNDGFVTLLTTTNYNNAATVGQKNIILDLNNLIRVNTVADMVVDIIPLLGQPDTQPTHFADSVHPNALGYSLIAQQVFAALP
jgi:lysophospholipase L1-like esterase